jgi:hypothetical protein
MSWNTETPKGNSPFLDPTGSVKLALRRTGFGRNEDSFLVMAFFGFFIGILHFKWKSSIWLEK